MTASFVEPTDPSVRHPPESVVIPPLRVLFVNDTARNGGPGRSLHSILKFLDPAVVHRAVVLPRPGAVADLLVGDGVVDELHFEPDLVENPMEPWGRPMERRDFDAPSMVKVVRLAGNAVKVGRGIARLAGLIRRGRYDLIYCNGTNADFAGGALAALTSVPALWHVRYSSIPALVAPLHDRLAASRGVRRIVCVSQAAAALFPHCPDKVTVLHNALDVAAFDSAHVMPTLRRELGLPEGAIVFGSHGRVLRRKGFIELARAARVALDRLSRAERELVTFVVVGDTPEDFRPDHVAECRVRAHELGLGGSFRMLGFREDVRPLVADFDVAVVPSVYADPLPRSVIEAMALGRPVIAFDVGGVSEMVDSETGTLVSFEPDRHGVGSTDGSVGRLAEALVRYARDRELRQRQGAAGRRRVVKDFDARTHALAIQQEIVRAAGRPERAPR